MAELTTAPEITQIADFNSNMHVMLEEGGTLKKADATLFRGQDGADGATGPQGPAGADGATGPQGPAGADGSDANSLGIGQSYGNYTSSRVSGTNYINSTAKPIFINILTISHQTRSYFYIGGVLVFTDINPQKYELHESVFFSFIIPPGAVYKFVAGGSINGWFELR